MLNLAVILLTFNEEKNLPACLASLSGLEAPLFVVDSFSTDGTLALLQQAGISFVQHPFANYAAQRNWAQANCPFETEWVLHLDAGERLTPELVQWLQTGFDPTKAIAGYMFSRRTIFMGRWIRYGGHYPNYHLRLFRKTHGHCENKVYDQHFVVGGPIEKLRPGVDIIDTVTDTLADFTRSHARWALFEAIEQVAQPPQAGEVAEKLSGTPIERRRWWKNRLFQRVPLFWRSFLYFGYRYILRGGFRDGRMGLVFHVLQGFWFRFLVDAHMAELRYFQAKSTASLEELVLEKYGEAFLRALKN